ncbi:MAG: AAA family ATPase [Acidimicrobiales bacterium]|nr:AAA family ATPase [Acidimicrobiales bacterium]
MTVLATYSIKGGVGKTTTAVNLAYLAAQEGARTLVWDLDPQGAATFYFRVKPKVKGGAGALVSGRRPLDDVVKGTDFENLDLVPADFSYRNMDLELDGAPKPTRTLRRLIKPVRAEYDVVILDCPPSISLVSENVFEAADALLVPLIPTTLSVRTLDQLEGFLDEHPARRPPELLAFFSMVDARKRLHRELMESLRAERRHVLDAQVPATSAVERMGVHRSPLPAFTRRGAAIDAYQQLWSEIRGRLGG